ncbi:MAG: hypothetical protein PVG25_07600, partial [Anaerolineae bacterium]
GAGSRDSGRGGLRADLLSDQVKKLAADSIRAREVDTHRTEHSLGNLRLLLWKHQILLNIAGFRLLARI